MTHDLLDRAFVNRLRTVGPSPAEAEATPRPREIELHGSRAIEPQIAAEAVASSMIDRLLAAAPSQWSAVADEIERGIAVFDGSLAGAARSGFVLAVVSRRPKDGCTTVVEGLARTLRDRGTEVVTTTFDRIDPDCGTVQLVDAGSWFGSGPIRRERATMLAESCDAAILLRRADRSTAAAFARALEVAGLRVLGEVTTFGRESASTPEATS